MECASAKLHSLVTGLGWWWIQWWMLMGFVIQFTIYQMPWGLRIYILRRPVEAKGKPRKEPTNAGTDNVGGVATESCLIKCVIGHLVLNQVCFFLCREIGEDSGWRSSSCTFSRKTQSDCTWSLWLPLGNLIEAILPPRFLLPRCV